MGFPGSLLKPLGVALGAAAGTAILGPGVGTAIGGAVGGAAGEAAAGYGGTAPPAGGHVEMQGLSPVWVPDPVQSSAAAPIAQAPAPRRAPGPGVFLIDESGGLVFGADGKPVVNPAYCQINPSSVFCKPKAPVSTARFGALDRAREAARLTAERHARTAAKFAAQQREIELGATAKISTGTVVAVIAGGLVLVGGVATGIYFATRTRKKNPRRRRAA